MEQGERRMTKEELEKEAVEYAEKINLQNVNISGVVRNHISQAYLASAEPREKRIAELEAEVKEWKDKADLWCKTANLKDHNIMINKELEKENAELKKDKDYFSDSLDKQIEVTLKIDAKLERAKEIIKSLLNVFPYDMPEEELDSGDKDMVKEAEQFLKDSEAEK